jgi:hypothetical protein
MLESYCDDYSVATCTTRLKRCNKCGFDVMLNATCFYVQLWWTKDVNYESCCNGCYFILCSKYCFAAK